MLSTEAFVLQTKHTDYSDWFHKNNNSENKLNNIILFGTAREM